MEKEKKEQRGQVEFSAQSIEKTAGALPPITDGDFRRLVAFVQNKYGIDLRQKRQLITSRLTNTIKGMGLSGFKEYVDFIMTKGTGDDINHLLSKLTTNYTYFMREMTAFDCFKSRILPDLVKRHQRDKNLSIWSAGCSTGQEAYNTAMVIDEYFGPRKKDWDTTILATDISMNVLSKAQKGIYTADELKDLPAKWRTKYLTALPDGRFQICDRLRKEVIFRPGNLMEPFHF